MRLEIPRLTRPLTVGEYAAIGATEFRTELQEGSLLFAPGPTRRSVRAMVALAMQIEDQVPDGLEVLTGIDVDLELAPAEQPGFVRRPDLIVGERALMERAEAQGELVLAADVRLVVEIVAPGSRRMDHLIKRSEYADARVPHYWIVDLDESPSLLAARLTDESGYVDDGPVTSTFTTTSPFPMTIDLAKLVKRRAGG